MSSVFILKNRRIQNFFILNEYRSSSVRYLVHNEYPSQSVRYLVEYLLRSMCFLLFPKGSLGKCYAAVEDAFLGEYI